MARRVKGKWYDIDLESGCWNCNLTPDEDGYCQKWNGFRKVMAHRLSYELHKGKIPNGLEIDHLCKNKRCVNPKHLEAVTKTVNVRRSSCTSLTEDKVKEIKSLYKQGLRQVDIGKMFDIGQDEVSRIINGLRWKLS